MCWFSRMYIDLFIYLSFIFYLFTAFKCSPTSLSVCINKQEHTQTHTHAHTYEHPDKSTNMLTYKQVYRIEQMQRQLESNTSD